MELYSSDISCGVTQIVGMSILDEEDKRQFRMAVAGVAELHHGDGGSEGLLKNQTYIFSDNSMGDGKVLAAIITKNKLGTITSTPWYKNPGTGNKIKVWTWRYNGHKPRAWVKEAKAAGF